MKKIENIKNKYFETKNVLKNNYILWYFVILIICIITCLPILKMHIASDTYNLMDLGYFKYPKQFFLRDARIISTVITYLAGIMNLKYSVYIVLMEIVSVIFTSISIYVVYKIILEIDTKISMIKKICIYFASILVIFNCMYIEYFLYAECAVMCLGVLISILAVREYEIKKDRNRVIKTLLLLIIAVFCYQGTVNLFVSLVTLITFIRKKDDKKILDKKEVINNLKEIGIAIVLFAICMIINVIMIFIINQILNIEQSRISLIGILQNFKEYWYQIKYMLVCTLIVNFNLWPLGITLFTICGVTIILINSSKQIYSVIKYIILVIISIGICIGPLLFLKQPSIEPRTSLSIGAILGMSIIYLSFKQDKKYSDKMILMFLIFYVGFNMINTINIFNSHIKTNELDNQMAQEIKCRIENYEKETGNKIEKIAYISDLNSSKYYKGKVNNYYSFTQRAFENTYCIIESLNYFCDRKFEHENMSQEIYKEYFEGKDWDSYSDEQLVFKENVMYMCVF